jgi:hypothetical protein
MIDRPDARSFAAETELTIDATPSGARLTLTQRGFPDARARDDFAAAWPDVLALLAHRVEPPASS